MLMIESALTLALASITIVSDAPNCGVTYNRHSDDFKGIIYDCNMFIAQATEHHPIWWNGDHQ
jgi:hypothetical protein